MENINEEEVHSLIEYFSKTTYQANYADDKAKLIMERCIELAKADYNVTVIENISGELSGHYPSHLIVMDSEININGDLIRDTIYEGIDSIKLREQIIRARAARCRTRFPVPVIFYQGKFICRSATLSSSKEIYTRSGVEMVFPGETPKPTEEEIDNCTFVDKYKWDKTLSEVRKEDIKLLNLLNVGTVADLMVENKKVKLGFNVSSSEKIDSVNRYALFTLMSLPYPGCEFFKEFRDQNYSADDLFFNWDQSFVDATIVVPRDCISNKLQIRWEDYKMWNLPTMTANYLLLLLHHTLDNSQGLLVHCISGWDRTPLFISLLRLCLWAEESAHKSLSPVHMLYFTISYDWFLFGHNLKDRKYKGEDIFFFCFYFLKVVMADDFDSIKCRGKRLGNNNVSISKRDEFFQSDEGDIEVGESACSQESNHSSPCGSVLSKSHYTSVLNQSDDSSIPGSIFLGDFLPHSSHNSDGNQSNSSSGSTVTECSIDSQKQVRARISLAGTTSPVAVPNRSSPRQRHESTSSLSLGSWQNVSITGSVKSSGSSNSRSSGPESASECSNKIKFASSDHSKCDKFCKVRKSRLHEIRQLFYKCYSQSVGHTLKEGGEFFPPLNSILGHITGMASGSQS